MHQYDLLYHGTVPGTGMPPPTGSILTETSDELFDETGNNLLVE